MRNLNPVWRRVGVVSICAALGAIELPTVWGQEPEGGGERSSGVEGALDELDSPFDLERLLELEVTSPGRKAEPWFYSPTAIEVLTEHDIRRFGATTIADTLRIVPGLHVARTLGNGYSIATRGFAGTVANKLQVLMDGRSLYTPLFSGVFWEVQDTLLEDIERIEVVRGPGAALWGANAINGVINITTKSARDTQGTFLMGGGGNEELGFGGVRYGAKVGESTYWRLYSKYGYRDEQVFSNGTDAEDFSEHWQNGFRIDSYFREVHQVTFQGDFYLNDFGRFGRDDSHARGANVLGRWNRKFSEDSDLQVQAYYDRSDRSVPLQYEEQRNTFDLDLQHRFQLGERNDIVWGGNYRLSEDQTGSEGTVIFDPQERTIQMVNGFVQDQISIVPDYLALTLGAKAERNDFSGFEFQPSARLAYTPGRSQVLWTAVSRAVRTPTRLESDVRLLAAPSVPIVTLRGNPEFESEDLIAYELGYRIQPVAHLSAEISTFYNRYDNLRTVEPSTPIGPLILMNERSGDTYGFEAATRWQPTELWWLTASYSLVREDLDFAPGSQDPTGGTSDVNDPTHIAKLRSLLSLGHGIEFDQVLRYVDRLPNPHVPSYLELNLRLGWRPKPGLELSVVGANLLDSSHPEFSGGAGLQPEVQRSVYGKVAWIF